MSSVAAHHRHFDGVPESVRLVRHTVADVLAGWGCEEFAEDAVLGASELAANAVLHSRSAFDLSVRRIHRGVRIEVVDRRPDVVPLPVPVGGAVAGVASERTTGRGLQMVAAVSRRWGFNTSQEFKAVWLEVGDGELPRLDEPVIESGYETHPQGPVHELELLALPVRAALSSGGHVDDLVRELQLTRSPVATEADLATLYELLDASAPARLAGRHSALEAAANGLDRFDMHAELSIGSLAAFTDLNAMLSDLSARLGPATVPLPPAVVEFRAWLLDEVSAQISGRAPRRCDLPE
jgi:anti-sigma regulatory factor (Ser/Thr protein kinase)